MKITDLARAIEPNCTFKTVGIRPGEKLHESLISEDEIRKTKVFDGIYIILPQFIENQGIHKKYDKYSFVSEGFVYRSDKNDDWLTVEDLDKKLNYHESYTVRASAHR